MAERGSTSVVKGIALGSGCFGEPGAKYLLAACPGSPSGEWYCFLPGCSVLHYRRVPIDDSPSAPVLLPFPILHHHPAVAYFLGLSVAANALGYVAYSPAAPEATFLGPCI